MIKNEKNAQNPLTNIFIYNKVKLYFNHNKNPENSGERGNMGQRKYTNTTDHIENPVLDIEKTIERSERKENRKIVFSTKIYTRRMNRNIGGYCVGTEGGLNVIEPSSINQAREIIDRINEIDPLPESVGAVINKLCQSISLMRSIGKGKAAFTDDYNELDREKMIEQKERRRA